MENFDEISLSVSRLVLPCDCAHITEAVPIPSNTLYIDVHPPLITSIIHDRPLCLILVENSRILSKLNPLTTLLVILGAVEVARVSTGIPGNTSCKLVTPRHEGWKLQFYLET